MNLNQNKPKKNINLRIGDETIVIGKKNVAVSNEGNGDLKVIEEFKKLAKKDIFASS